MPDALLQCEKLCLQFGERTILDNINLSLNPGEIVTLIGPNGAGKTSLVRALLGLIQPTTGKVVQHSDLRIGYMPQKLHVEVSLPLTAQRFLGLTGANKREVADALQHVGISHLAKSPIQRLSGGETQRVLLARALLRKPNLLILDEPAQGVDVVGQAELYELIGQIRHQTGCGVLMVSHDLHLVMAATDSVICLNQHVCCQGHPESVSNDPAYLELFGRSAHPAIAVYTHHHDHSHDIHGDVVCGDQHSHTGDCPNKDQHRA
ncbi:zinc ABC transporter ATP-binding protein ZnuC [Maricurvus nonylphenolicus]|uniref:zinc ABC transporter ATP-binding protein ZnuC n=1 Tax=Maricurvus nonylphenolicus TaxID=1008307 RepID=UPI0036F28637